MTTTGRIQGDLPERTYRFARLVVRIVQQLPQATDGWVIGKQLARAGTAIGANVCEADVSLTDREFVQFCNIARREAFETRYWLRLCQDELGLNNDQVSEAFRKVDELARISHDNCPQEPANASSGLRLNLGLLFFVRLCFSAFSPYFAQRPRKKRDHLGM